MRPTILPLVLLLLCSSLRAAPAAERESNPTCIDGYRGGVACTVNWNTGGLHKTACDLITEAVAEGAFDGPAARPVHINVLLTGWVHSKSLDVCEFNSLAQGSTISRTITLYVYYPPFELGDWPRYFRDGLTSMRDVEWAGAVAYWAEDPIGEEQPNLYVFHSKRMSSLRRRGLQMGPRPGEGNDNGICCAVEHCSLNRRKGRRLAPSSIR